MKIIFRPSKKETGHSGNQPVPGSQAIPDWYQKLPRYDDGSKKFKYGAKDNSFNLTAKACTPFIDGFVTGYVVKLEYDVYVEAGTVKNGWVPQLSWRYGGELISTHNPSQFSSEQVPPGFYRTAFKFHNEWAIQTPKGYSLVVTHPLNRTDLPFQTMSAVVDTDTFERPVYFPFLLRSDFDGIISAGTPIAQVFPLKRESWSHEIENYDELKQEKINIKFFSKFFGAYKATNWSKKDYK